MRSLRTGACEVNKIIDDDSATEATPVGYIVFLREIKEDVRTSQLRAAMAVNSELVGLD